MIRSLKRAILASFLALGLLTMGTGQCQAGGRSSGGHYGGYGGYRGGFAGYRGGFAGYGGYRGAYGGYGRYRGGYGDYGRYRGGYWGYGGCFFPLIWGF